MSNKIDNDCIDIDIEPIFLDRREEDRRQEDQGPGFLKEERRSGSRRASGFAGQDWWLQCNYLDSKRKRF